MTLVARADSGLTSLADLRGQRVTVAVTQVTLAATLKYLQLLGATPELVHYDGGSETMLATVRGDVQAAVQVAPTVARAVAANPGALRPLAVLAEDRVADLPEVPTTAEVGAPLTADVTPFARYSYAFAAPPDTPAPVLRTLETAIADAARDSGCAADVARAKLPVVHEPADQVAESMQPFADGLLVIREDLLRAAVG
jgi:tripartite-type tricarboxylate transporter receptor subunit TctC